MKNKTEASDSRLRNLINEIEKSVGMLEKILSERRPSVKDEFYLTDVELSDRLKVSRRTLQERRTDGTLPHYLVVGKILYAESEIQKYLEKNYIKSVKDITNLI